MRRGVAAPGASRYCGAAKPPTKRNSCCPGLRRVLSLAALLAVLSVRGREVAAVTGKEIDMQLVRQHVPPEPTTEDWDLELVVDSAAQLRQAICTAQGAEVNELKPWECYSLGGNVIRTRIIVVTDISLGGARLPLMSGTLEIAGQCGPSLSDACNIHAVGQKCSQCPTPFETRGNTSVCEDCKEGEDFAETRPFWLAPGSRLWMTNISVRGCRSRSSGGCVYVQNGNSEAWRVGEFLRATRLTYLKARNVTIARGFSRGYGGGLCIGRGAIVDMEEGVFEDNYSDIDGLGTGVPSSEVSHDVVIENYSAMLAKDVIPEAFLVRLVPVLDYAGSSFNGDYVKGFLNVSQSLPPISETLEGGNGTAGPTPAPTQLLPPAPPQLPPEIGILESTGLPLWVYLTIVGVASLVVFAAGMTVFCCCCSPSGAAADNPLDEEKNPWDKKAEGALHLVHNIQGDPRAYVEGSSEASQTQEANTRPPAPLQVSAWNEHQAEQVAAHIEKLSQQGRPHERLDPINGRQRSPSPLSWQMAQAQRVGSPPLPASSKGAAAGLVGSAPAAASPTLKDIARNPLRPPTSRPVLPTAVWKPHRHTPMAALGPQEARPSTAPSYVTVGVGFSPSSWGFGPELRPNSAQNAHRQPSARIIRQTRRPADSSQDGPKPAWRYLVEPKETKGELPSPTGPRPRVHDGLYRGSDGDNVYADRNRSQEFR